MKRRTNFLNQPVLASTSFFVSIRHGDFKCAISVAARHRRLQITACVRARRAPVSAYAASEAPPHPVPGAHSLISRHAAGISDGLRLAISRRRNQPVGNVLGSDSSGDKLMHFSLS
jgi:hypothetical protein